MVFARLLGCEAHMTTGLPRDLVTVSLQPRGKFTTREVSWYPHAAITSSRTKWRRISLGTSSSS
jgi:hypothetical protein